MSVYILFDSGEFTKNLEKAQLTHPKLNQSIVSKIAFSESTVCIFTQEKYANAECNKRNREGSCCTVIQRKIDDPSQLQPAKKLSDMLGGI